MTAPALQYETCHAGAGLLKLAPVFWGLPRTAALLLGYLIEVQELEDAIFSFLNGIDVDTCGRFALEGLAKIVGEKRRPENTDTLRIFVKGKITVNRSDGTPPALAAVILSLTSGEVQVIDGYDEFRVLQITPPDPVDADAAAEMLDAAVQGGAKACWLTNAGAGGCARPGYGTAPDDTRRRGFVPRSDYHG
jgi:hypothetical protein